MKEFKAGFRYPTLAEAGPSFGYLAYTVRNPGNWNQIEGGLHLYAAGGYLQSCFLGTESDVAAQAAEDEPVTAEALSQGLDCLAAQGRGEAAPLAIGQGQIRKFIREALGELAKSGLPQQVFAELLKRWLTPALPG